LLQGFFHESSSPKPLKKTLRTFFRKFAEIFASHGPPPVSTTPGGNLKPVLLVSLKRRQIATGINDTGGKFTTVANNGNYVSKLCEFFEKNCNSS
jgi:hypothetical protein